MTGAPPYNAQSPTQQHRFGPYDSPSKNRPFYPSNEQPPPAQQQPPHHQYPPQTPPAFGPSSISRSPHFAHASPMPSSLPPPLNGAAPPSHPPPPDSSQYQGHSAAGAPQLPYPRPFSSSVLPGNGASPYGPSTPHGHPSNRPEGHSQSPSREPESPYRMRANGPGYGPSMMQEPRPASPPRESVCFEKVTDSYGNAFLTNTFYLETCSSRRSDVLCQHLVWTDGREARKEAISSAFFDRHSRISSASASRHQTR